MRTGPRGAFAAVISLLALFHGAGALAADCPSPPPLTLRADPDWIDRDVEVLFDPDDEYTAEQVLSQPLCGQFEPVEGTPNFTTEQQKAWLRLRLPDVAGDGMQRRLLVRYAGLIRLCVHWPVGEAGVESQCTGVTAPHGLSHNTRAGFYFDVPADFDPRRSVLLYAEDDVWLKVPMEFGSASAFILREHARQTTLGAMYGLLFAAVLFGAALYLSRRDAAYLYFAGFLLTYAIWNAAWENHLSAWGLTGRPAGLMLGSVLCISQILGSRFYQLFLGTAQKAPLLHKLLTSVMIAFGVAAVLDPLWPREMGPVLGVLVLLWLVLVVGASLQRLLQGHRLALAALLSQAALLLNFLLRGLESVGIQPLDAQYIDLSIGLASLLSVGFLGFGLVYRVRAMSTEHQRLRDLAVSSSQLALHRAHYDELTRLPNRVKFRDDLQEYLGLGCRWALFSMGLDRLGAINSTLGHRSGDGVLLEVAQRLQRTVKDAAMPGRTGPDVFSWSLPVPDGVEPLTLIQETCRAVQRALAEPLEIGGGITLTACIGVSLFPQHASAGEPLLQCAETALNQAKKVGHGGVVVFAPFMHEMAAQHLELGRELRRALEGGELSLRYQPIVALETGDLLAVEALSVWRRKDGGEVPPDQFLGVAESGDLLRPFTEWSLRTACAQMSDWRRRGVPVPYTSVNLSAAQLRLDGVAEMVFDAMAANDILGTALSIEVTEGALIGNLDATRAMLARLRLRGIAIAVDDFGVGYASHHYLRELPVQILKIDGSFLRRVPEDPKSCALLDGMIDLGRNLRLRVVPEHVENDAQRRYLIGRGVREGQGWLFSRSLSADKLEEWLRRGGWKRDAGTPAQTAAQGS